MQLANIILHEYGVQGMKWGTRRAGENNLQTATRIAVRTRQSLKSARTKLGQTRILQVNKKMIGRIRAIQNRGQMAAMYKELGMTKVKGNLGGTYYESKLSEYGVQGMKWGVTAGRAAWLAKGGLHKQMTALRNPQSLGHGSALDRLKNASVFLYKVGLEKRTANVNTGFRMGPKGAVISKTRMNGVTVVRHAPGSMSRFYSGRMARESKINEYGVQGMKWGQRKKELLRNIQGHINTNKFYLSTANRELNAARGGFAAQRADKKIQRFSKRAGTLRTRIDKVKALQGPSENAVQEYGVPGMKWGISSKNMNKEHGAPAGISKKRWLSQWKSSPKMVKIHNDAKAKIQMAGVKAKAENKINKLAMRTLKTHAERMGGFQLKMQKRSQGLPVRGWPNAR